MLGQPFGMPKIDTGKEITLLAHRKLLQYFFYVDVRHLVSLGLIECRNMTACLPQLVSFFYCKCGPATVKKEEAVEVWREPEIVKSAQKSRGRLNYGVSNGVLYSR